MNTTLLKFLTIPLLLYAVPALGQQVGIKTNALYWGTTTPNLAVEYATGIKNTLHLSGAYNPWTFGSDADNKKIQHWSISGQYRFWFNEIWDGSFLAPSVSFTSYNAGGVNLPVPFDNFKDFRYEGYAIGAGLTYGYQWYLGHHWNLEATFGLSYYYLNYEKYDCGKCGRFIGKDTKHWFGPANVGISFIYLFKSKKY